MIIVFTAPGHTCVVGPSGRVGHQVNSTSLARSAAATFKCDVCGHYWCAICIGKNRGECPRCLEAVSPLLDTDPLVERLVKTVANARCEQHDAIDCEHRPRKAVEALECAVKLALQVILKNGGMYDIAAEFGAPWPVEK